MRMRACDAITLISHKNNLVLAGFARYVVILFLGFPDKYQIWHWNGRLRTRQGCQMDYAQVISFRNWLQNLAVWCKKRIWQHFIYVEVFILNLKLHR